MLSVHESATASGVGQPGRLGNRLVLALLLVAALAMLALHDDPWWIGAPTAGRIAWASVLAAGFAIACLLPAWRRRVDRSRAGQDALDDPGGAEAVLVAYASQTGFALALAELTLQALRASGTPAERMALSDVDASVLHRYARALFIASTTGEGDPPDTALAFVRRTMASAERFPALRYAVLALGDRNYEAFCGFGHQLAHWLRQAGAQPLFDTVEVDNGDAAALRHWQHHLDVLSGGSSIDWAPAQYQRWRLLARRELNPGSVGGAVFHLALQPADGVAADWQAGDIAEVGPRNSDATVAAWLAEAGQDGEAIVASGDSREPLQARLLRARLPAAGAAAGLDPAALARDLQPLPHREYSIASIPGEGTLQLLVRRMAAADGTPGLGSGYLCAHAATGACIDLRLRANPNFHPPGPERPMILVGNGTGIAGLRAHLAARAAVGAGRNWLLFGERHAAVDFHLRSEIESWQAGGTLQRLDVAFSRDGGVHRYVQDVLRARMQDVAAWLDDGAVIYVCGSLHGMAPGVDAVLREALGDARVDALLDDGRYRRDVY
ncbi:MAG TPA: flavodoxin domain-containing protein [Luteimonas sp.]|nr:flavodoxin domain-containing protein [Luteimonas sp.]